MSERGSAATASWRDAARGGGRVVIALALPAALMTAQLAGAANAARGFFLIPGAVVVAASAAGGVVGVWRARRLRRIAGALGLGFTHSFHARSAVASTRLYPFDDNRRRTGDAVIGTTSGYPTAVFAYGAKTLVHTVRVREPLPPMQIVPAGAAGAYDVGTGAVTRTESAQLTRDWRIVAPDPRWAHASLPPSVLAALASVGQPRPIIAWDGHAVWTVDRGVRLEPEQSVERLKLLVSIAAGIPTFIARDYATALAAERKAAQAPGARPAAPPLFAGKRREKNILGRLSVVLAFSVVGTPLGILMGIAALRAYRRGEADNLRVARIGIVLSSVGLALTILMVVAGVIAQTTGTP